MMLSLSMGSKGEEVDLSSITGGVDAVDERVPCAREILQFGEAVLAGTDPELDQARRELIDAVGGDAFVDAAGVVGHFERMVRVADATGIPLDAMAEEATVDIRDELGINEFAMADRTLNRNSDNT